MGNERKAAVGTYAFLYHRLIFMLVSVIHGGLTPNSCLNRGWYSMIIKSNMQLSKPWITCSDSIRYWLRRVWKCVFLRVTKERPQNLNRT